jgi:uncharacterized repeat protein (TIGR02543 family)
VDGYELELFVRWNLLPVYTVNYTWDPDLFTFAALGETANTATITRAIGTTFMTPAPTTIHNAVTFAGVGGWFNADTGVRMANSNNNASLVAGTVLNLEARPNYRTGNAFYHLDGGHSAALAGNANVNFQAAQNRWRFLGFSLINQYVLPSDPVKAGFIFGGWYTDAALTIKAMAFNADRNAVWPGASIDFYAKWEQSTFNISYVYDIDTILPANLPTSYVNGVGVSFSGIVPTSRIPGNVFKGFFLAPGDGDPVDEITTTDTGDKLFYIVFEREKVISTARICPTIRTGVSVGNDVLKIVDQDGDEIIKPDDPHINPAITVVSSNPSILSINWDAARGVFVYQALRAGTVTVTVRFNNAIVDAAAIRIS